MGQVSLSGSLVAGASGVVSGGGLPGMRLDAPVSLLSEPKPYSKATGILQDVVASPLAFAVLPGVGASGTVRRATTLYLRCASSLELRLTFDDGVGGTQTALLPLRGLLVHEATDERALVLVEAKGDGVAVEYFAAGPA